MFYLKLSSLFLASAFASNVVPEKEMRLFYRTSPDAARKLWSNPDFQPAVARLLDLSRWLETPRAEALFGQVAEKWNERELAFAREQAAHLQNDVVLEVRCEEEVNPREKYTERESELIVERVSQGEASERKAVRAKRAEQFSLSRLLAEENSLNPSGLNPEPTGEELFGSFLPPEIDFIGDRNIVALAHTVQFRDPGEAVRVAMGRTQDELGKKRYLAMFHLLSVVTGDRKAGAKFLGEIAGLEAWQSFLKTFWTAVDLEPVLQSHIEKAIPVRVTFPEDRKQLVQFGRVFLSHLFADYLPTPYEPLTADALIKVSRKYLAQTARQLVDAQERLARSQDLKTAPLESSSEDQKSVVKIGTRAERIEAHRRMQDERRLERVIEDLKSSSTQQDSPSPVPAEVSGPVEVSEDELERRIALKTISAQRAENILNLYGTLGSGLKTQFRQVISELLTEKRQRLKSLSADIQRVRGSDFYQVRLGGGSTPVRLYFGIDSVEGPMLITADIIRSDAEQKQRARAASEAWHKYQNRR